MKLKPMGIALRTALLSWFVTLATLLIFVFVILPWQKYTLLKNLESKAQSVATSLRDVAAGAAVNEDYSSVVDHCKEMLAGDESLAYLVMTKNDGFSVVQDRTGWRSEDKMGPEWRPAKREPAGAVRFVPLFQKRVFHFAQPFDYSGIQWGWIHVGLSLDKYDRSVASLYWLTALLGVGCGGLSLLASVTYARRLVRPILNLRATVQRVAGGDLSARATTFRTDELGSLATSVNSMTEALLRRDDILGSVQFAAQRFLGAADWRSVIDGVLARIGQSAGVSRAYVFENRLDTAGRLVMHSLHEWVAAGRGTGDLPPAGARVAFDDAGFVRWREVFERREIIAARVCDLPESERTLLAAQHVRALLVIPIFVEDRWWGFLGLDDCVEERQWGDAERDSLRAAGDMLGAAIARQHTQDALLEAKTTLEQRVRERTEALQQENLERREAEAALARSLSVINTTLESTVDGILVLDRDGRVKHFNRRFSEMWRLSPEFLTSGQTRKILAAVTAQLKDPKPFLKKSLELHFDPAAENFDVAELKDGRVVERFTRPQQSDGVSAGRVWCCRDITERRRAEAEIAYERDLLQTLLDSLPDTLFFKDLQSRFVRVSRSKAESALATLRDRHDQSRAAGEPAGYPPHLQTVTALREWLAGRTDCDILGEAEAQPRLAEEQEIIRTGQPLTEKIESFTRGSGATAWYLVTKMPWRDEHGRIIGTYGISKNITAIKEAEEKLGAVHQELMLASRQAGMAEVATDVLHNVGNVLNSVNVSATLVREKLQASEVATLVRVAALLRDHAADLAGYLTRDAKGKVIPAFLIELADHLAQEHRVLREEHEQLTRNVEHIKEIVAMQQSYARVSGVLEKLRLADLVGDALRINTSGLARHGVRIERRFADVPMVVTDRHKVLQILVNLINNAKYALDDAERTDRQITLTIEPGAESRIRVIVADNGIGIPPENLLRVFSRGFTTRRDGHGFGLHSGAIAAKELGGGLTAASDGPGRGATFVLELPTTSRGANHEPAPSVIPPPHPRDRRQSLDPR